MLARLDDVPGVLETRVDASGRFFRVELRSDHDPAAAIETIRGVLDADARQLSESAAAEQLSAALRGDPWLSGSEVMTLSYVEARILSVRISSAAAAELPALGAASGALAEAVRVELFDTMDRVHRAGGRPNGGWIYTAWPEIARAAITRCAADLPPGVRAALEALLPRLLVR